VVLGKPSPAFFHYAIPDGMDPNHVCMVGDDVHGDIGGAQQAGMGTTVLVQTGKYAPGDEAQVPPTRVVPSIVEAVDYILEQIQQR